MKEIKFASPLRTASILVIVVICFVILSWAADVIIPLLFAIIFSSMLFPICFQLEKWGCHKGVAAFFAVLAAGIVTALFLGLVISQVIHLMGQGPQFVSRLTTLLDKVLIDDTMQKIYVVIQNYLLGLLKVIAIIGTLNSVGLWALGIESPLFFGFLGGILVIIPYIGILIGAALPVIVALVTKDSYWYAGGVLGVFLFVHILEGNVITPYVVGSKVSINPLVAVFSLLLFGKLWGLSITFRDIAFCIPNFASIRPPR
jgi:predicted PurR-regulated permease PerM